VVVIVIVTVRPVNVAGRRVAHSADSSRSRALRRRQSSALRVAPVGSRVASLIVVRHGDRLSIQRLRQSLPLPVFVVVLVLLVVMLGFACLCMTDHPTQAAERAISAIAHSPAIIEMWAAAIVLFSFQILLPALVAHGTSGRVSPVYLQSFRF